MKSQSNYIGGGRRVGRRGKPHPALPCVDYYERRWENGYCAHCIAPVGTSGDRVDQLSADVDSPITSKGTRSEGGGVGGVGGGGGGGGGGGNKDNQSKPVEKRFLGNADKRTT